MQDEHTPTEPQKASSQTPVAAAAPQSTLAKDLMIPVSIVLAGIFVGAGLYFSAGTGGGATAPAPSAPAQAAQADNTDKVKPISAEDDYFKGDIDAPIQIVEFSDYDCPFCSRFHDVMNAVVEKYPDDVVWTYRHFPIEQLHPQAPAVAIAAECVGELEGNDAFWSFTDAYFQARGAQDGTAHDVLIPRLALAAGVTQADFTTCFESGDMTARVQADMQNAGETGGRGTPWSILIGPSGKTYPINGALPQSSIEQLISVAKAEA
jgi:protein-disulfide isomerase